MMFHSNIALVLLFSIAARSSPISSSDVESNVIDHDLSQLLHSNHSRLATTICPCRPVCARGTGFINPVCWSTPSLRYRYKWNNDNIGDIHRCLYSLFLQIKGQKDAINTLIGQINRKLYDPRASFLVHLAGDNGVGKTLSASLLSIAISLFPHSAHKNAGESLLIVPGSEFANVSPEKNDEIQAAEAKIRSRLVNHVQKFSKCVVLFDEITQMHPKLMRELSPLFAAIEHGESIDEVPMTSVFCFLTSDFGSNGKTLGMTPIEVRTWVWEVIQETYQHTPALKKANIIPFVSLSPIDFQEAIRYRLNTLKCHHEQTKSLFGRTRMSIVKFIFDEEALVDFLYCKALAGIPQRNGREIDRIFDDYIDGPLIMRLAEFEMNISDEEFSMRNSWESLVLGHKFVNVLVIFRVTNSAEAQKELSIEVSFHNPKD